MFNPMKSDKKREFIQLKFPYDQECPICFGNMKDKVVKYTICKHVFHKSCLNKWLQNKSSCPSCRSYVKPLKEIKDDEEFESIRDLLNSIDLDMLSLSVLLTLGDPIENEQ